MLFLLLALGIDRIIGFRRTDGVKKKTRRRKGGQVFRGEREIFEKSSKKRRTSMNRFTDFIVMQAAAGSFWPFSPSSRLF